MVCPPEHGCGLVEDPARHAHCPELCPPARVCELERLELERRDGAECRRDRDFERGRRREAGTQRDGCRQGGGEADGRAAERCELLCDSGRIPAPSGRLLDRATVRWKVDTFRRPVRGEPDPAVRDAFDPDAHIQRGRQDKAAAVVDVLAEKVHAARSPKGTLCAHGTEPVSAGAAGSGRNGQEIAQLDAAGRGRRAPVRQDLDPLAENQAGIECFRLTRRRS